jgi:Leucine-rich repeat (LRR) protein
MDLNGDNQKLEMFHIILTSKYNKKLREKIKYLKNSNIEISNLNSLNLNNLKLTSIPEHIRILTQLTSFSLEENSIANIDFNDYTELHVLNVKCN